MAESSTLNLFIPGELDDRSVRPLYEQLVENVKNKLANGTLIAGQMMPGTRDLSEHLIVSRKTVRRAYEELLSQGYFETQRGIGTFVAERSIVKKWDGLDLSAGSVRPILSPYAQSLLATSAEPSTLDTLHLLNFDAAPAGLLPLKQWRQCTLELWRAYDWNELEYDFYPRQHTRLQKVLVDYLLRARGLRCSSDQIAVFGSVRPPLWALCRLLLDPGDHVAMERPGYPFARSVFKMLGCQITDIPIDAEGLNVELLAELTPAPKLIYVTPSHEPTGVTLSMRRREQLAQLARQKNIVIIESDYDCEFDSSYSRLPTLYSLCGSERTVYLSYFWKTLYPLVTCGLILMPANLTKAYKLAERELDNGCYSRLPCIEEATLERFLSQGLLERHTSKVAVIYAARQEAMIRAIKRDLNQFVVLPKEPAGMHLHITLNVSLDQETIMEIAGDTDFPLAPMAPFFGDCAPSNEYLLAFGQLEEPAIERVVADFARRLNNKLSCT